MARFGAKPRLCRSSWRAVSSTHPLILSSISPREALLACPPSPQRNLPSFTVESTFSSPCSRSDPLLSLAKVRHSPTLTLSHLTIWCSGQTILFLLFLAKTALASLPTALSMASRLLFPFQRAQYAQVFPLKSAPFCTLMLVSAAPISLRLLFSFSLIWLCPHQPVLSSISLTGTVLSLSPPVLSGYNGSPDTRFSRATMRLMSWPDGVRYLRPPQSLVVSLLLSLVSTLVFSRTRGVLPH